MKHIFLVRHARYENPRDIFPGRLPVVLSKKGKLQAEKMAAFLADKQIDQIFSSAVLRCQETSEIIAKGKTPITNDQRLLEVLSAYQGYWFGPLDSPEWSNVYRHRDELGGESTTDVQERIVDFFNELVTLPFENVVVCSHGDALFFLYLSLMHRPLTGNMIPPFEARFPDYQPKASIREIVWESTNKYRIGEVKKF